MDLSLKAEDRFICQNVRDLKTRYRIRVVSKTDFPKSVIDRFGSPASIKCASDGFWVLFQKLQEKSLVKVTDDLKDVRLILQSEKIKDYCADEHRQRLYVCMANTTDLYSKQPGRCYSKKALFDPNNQIAEYSTNGEFVRKVVSASEQKVFPALITVLNRLHLVYHDYVANEIRKTDMTGKIISKLSLDRRLIRRLKISINNNIYLVSLSSSNWLGWDTGQMRDLIYRLDENLRLELFYSGPFLGARISQLLDVELYGDYLFYVSDHFFGKLDLFGKEVFRVSISTPVWQKPSIPAKIMYLAQSTREDRIIYGLTFPQPKPSLYRIAV